MVWGFPVSQDHPLPRNSQGVARTEWRHAGPLAHYKSSAAAALLLQDRPNGWTSVPQSWCAALLYKGGVFMKRARLPGQLEHAFLSLGFMDYCALGVRMTKKEFNGKDIRESC